MVQRVQQSDRIQHLREEDPAQECQHLPTTACDPHESRVLRGSQHRVTDGRRFQRLELGLHGRGRCRILELEGGQGRTFDPVAPAPHCRGNRGRRHHGCTTNPLARVPGALARGREPERSAQDLGVPFPFSLRPTHCDHRVVAHVSYPYADSHVLGHLVLDLPIHVLFRVCVSELELRQPRNGVSVWQRRERSANAPNAGILQQDVTDAPRGPGPGRAAGPHGGGGRLCRRVEPQNHQGLHQAALVPDSQAGEERGDSGRRGRGCWQDNECVALLLLLPLAEIEPEEFEC
mmetsp:Transcript_45017/g.144248  ORF Transcript_45017/g.144248 Transcript_45017/m.144248 type:complete len:290 (-) Transcript_45017:873-1742(-)